MALALPGLRLAGRFAHLGVYSRDQVRRVADRDGRVMALRFSHTRLLDQPVTLDRYAELLRAEGRGLALAGPQPVTEQVFGPLPVGLACLAEPSGGYT